MLSPRATKMTQWCRKIVSLGKGTRDNKQELSAWSPSLHIQREIEKFGTRPSSKKWPAAEQHFFLVEGQGKVFPWLDAEGQTPGATVTFTSCLVAVGRRKWWSRTAGHLSRDFRMTRTGVGKGKFASPGKETEFLGNLVAQSSTVTCLKAQCDRWDTLVYPQSPNPSHGRLLVLQRVHTTAREAHSH